MFSSGDCTNWIIVDKVELIGTDGNKYYANEKRTILRSWDNTLTYKAVWYRRKNNKEDPWVSRWDHPRRVLYGGNSVNGHNDVIRERNGADVFIRRSKFSTILFHL